MPKTTVLCFVLFSVRIEGGVFKLVAYLMFVIFFNLAPLILLLSVIWVSI